MNTIAAQVSLYPLRRERLGPVIEEAIETFRRAGLLVTEGPMSTVVAGELDAVFAALREAFARATAHGEAVMVVTVSNGCPVPTPSDA
jgi:uncharacterized protein YqgV (UPF0045/DUF77 family)